MPEDNNPHIEGQGIVRPERGTDDREARHPTNVREIGRSRFTLPEQPRLVWKVVNDNAYVDGSSIICSFAVDEEQNAIIVDCDNAIPGPLTGRVVRVSCRGETTILCDADTGLKPAVIDGSGFIYLTTADGPMNPSVHKLYCLHPNGDLKWEFPFGDSPDSKPVVDNHGNVYLCTFGDMVGSLYSIGKDGSLNWSWRFRSAKSCQPIVSPDGVIYLGINANEAFFAIDQQGQVLWERVLGRCSGGHPPLLGDDGSIYTCVYDSREGVGVLLALGPDGGIRWRYAPQTGHVATPPAIDDRGNLYFGLSGARLASLTSGGEERWIARLQDDANRPPIIGRCNRICQQSSMPHSPNWKSWIETFSEDGEKTWTYQLAGVAEWMVLADDDLLYVLTNRATYTRKGWLNKKLVRWELHAIGGQGSC